MNSSIWGAIVGGALTGFLTLAANYVTKRGSENVARINNEPDFAGQVVKLIDKNNELLRSNEKLNSENQSLKDKLDSLQQKYEEQLLRVEELTRRLESLLGGNHD